MAGEDAVTLKEHLERILSERDERYEQRFQAQETANALSVAATREALTLALSATEKTSAAALEANTARAIEAEKYADQKLQTHNNIKPWVQSLTDASVARIEALERRVARFENREEGMTLSTKLALGAVGALATLAGLAATLVGLYFAFVN
jgi:hypothetical protein